MRLPKLPSFWNRKNDGMTTLDLYKALAGYDFRLSSSNKLVNWKTAIQVSTVFACARVLCNGVSQVPLKLYRLSPDGKTRTEARDHPLFKLLHRRPNEWQTSFEFRETLMLHLALTFNAFCFKNIVRGEILELIPFEPRQVQVIRNPDYSLTYRVTDLKAGSQRDFPQTAIWHLKGPSWSSWQGMEATRLASDAIGLGMAAEEHHAKSFANGAKAGGVLSVDGTLDEKQHADLTKWVHDHHEGSDKAYKTLIMDRNAKWLAQAFSGIDMQLLETRKFQVEEVCRGMNVLPIMIGHSGDKNATFASAEQMFLAHLVHTMMPWYERIEQSIDANLLTDEDAEEGLYAKFVEEGLLRGSLKDTQAYLLGLVNGGLMTPNEGRAKLDLNPDSDPKSDKLREPANLVGKSPASPDSGD